MAKYQNLTLKRILKRHKKNPQDRKLHETIKRGGVGKKKFLELIKRAVC